MTPAPDLGPGGNHALSSLDACGDIRSLSVALWRAPLALVATVTTSSSDHPEINLALGGGGVTCFWRNRLGQLGCGRVYAEALLPSTQRTAFRRWGILSAS